MNRSLSSITREISEECLSRKLRSLNRVISAVYDDALREHGLRTTQLTLLVAIDRLGGEATSTNLGARLNLQKSTLSRNLARLEGEGWISRRPDGRQIFLSLSTRGAKVLRKAYPAWCGAQREVAAWMDGEFVQSVEDLLAGVPEEQSA